MRKALILISLFLLPASSFAATYGSNFLTGGSCTAESYDSAPYSCEKSFDANIATKWSSGSAENFPVWIRYDLGVGNEKILAKTDIYVVYSPIKTYQIEGSNDDAEWILLSESQTADATGDYYTYPTSTVPYRYFRLTAVDRWNSGTNYAEIFEWTGYECTDCEGSSGTISTSTAYTEICYSSATSTSCYRPLDVYKSYAIDGLFFLVPLWVGVWAWKRKKVGF